MSDYIEQERIRNLLVDYRRSLIGVHNKIEYLTVGDELRAATLWESRGRPALNSAPSLKAKKVDHGRGIGKGYRPGDIPLAPEAKAVIDKLFKQGMPYDVAFGHVTGSSYQFLRELHVKRSQGVTTPPVNIHS